ncbi:MAG: ferredoxin [Betaproteobacteria bacterium]
MSSHSPTGFRVLIDTHKCVGSGQCVVAEPEVFDQGEADGVVVLIQPYPDAALRPSVERAARLCPAQVIRLQER